MSVEAVNGAIFEGDVVGAMKSGAEFYYKAVKEALISKGSTNKFEGVMMAAFSPIMLPLVLSSVAIGAGICKVGEKIESKKSNREPGNK